MIEQNISHGFEESKIALEKILETRKPSFVAIVCGKTSFEKTGAKNWLIPILSGTKNIIIDDFSPNPKADEFEKIRQEIPLDKVDLFIGVGGGSSMDMMKLLQIFQQLPADLSVADYMKNPVEPAGQLTESIAIPTTAGSGSEATSFAVVYVDKQKNSLDTKLVIPRNVFLIPELLKSLPASIRAATATDALSQAIESYWSSSSTEQSQKIAASAIKMLHENIVEYVAGNDETIPAILEGSFLAGKAIMLTRTTAPHAVSYCMTSYFGLPHGTAVGLTLGEFLCFNSLCTPEQCNDTRGCEHVKKTTLEIAKLLGANDENSARENWRKMLAKIGISYKLSDHNIPREKLHVLVEGASEPKRLANNPRSLTKPQLEKMLTEIF